MRRAAQANWSRLPNHNPPRFYTAWVIRHRGDPAASPAISAVTPKAEVNSERWAATLAVERLAWQVVEQLVDQVDERSVVEGVVVDTSSSTYSSMVGSNARRRAVAISAARWPSECRLSP